MVLVQELPEQTTQEERAALAKSIRQKISEKHGIDVYAVVFSKQGSIPRTASGKLQRSVCKKQYLEKRSYMVIKMFCDLEIWKI